MSHQELYDAVCGGNDPTAIFDASDKWITLGNSMLESSNTLHERIAASASGWQGTAAESSRAAMTQLVDWSGKASQTAQYMGHQLNEQGHVLATAKANMPKPVPFQLGRVSTQPGLSGFSNSLVDAQPAQQAVDEAHARAIDVATAMEEGSAQIDMVTPEFEPVPVAHLRRNAGRTISEPVRNRSDRQLMTARTNATKAIPVVASSGATTPSGATTGSPAVMGSAQGPLSDRVAALDPAAGTQSSFAPNGFPSAGPGSGVPVVAPTSVPSVDAPAATTTTSGYGGGLPVSAPPPSDVPSFTSGGIGAGPTAGGGGDMAGIAGVGGTGGGAAGGAGRAGGVGPSSGIRGGVGGGVAGEKMSGSYRPGSISARLDSESSLSGSRPTGGGAGATEAERASGAASGAGAAGSGKGKEEDKQHQSTGYVQGEDIFEPLGADLAPPVIGGRLPKQSS